MARMVSTMTSRASRIVRRGLSRYASNADEAKYETSRRRRIEFFFSEEEEFIKVDVIRVAVAMNTKRPRWSPS